MSIENDVSMDSSPTVANDVEVDSSPTQSVDTSVDTDDLSDLPDDLFDDKPLEKEPEAVDTPEEDTENPKTEESPVEPKEEDSPPKDKEPTPGSKEYNFKQLREQKARIEKENNSLQEELLKYKKAMEFVLKKQQEDKSKLDEYRELTPEQRELENYRLDKERVLFQQKLQEELGKLRQEFTLKAQQQEQARILEQEKNQYLNEMDSIVSKHPVLTHKILAAAVKEDMDNGGDGDFARVAQEWDNKFLENYGPRYAEQNKLKSSAPKVISSKGAVRPAYNESDEDTIRWLDAELGDDWDKSR